MPKFLDPLAINSSHGDLTTQLKVLKMKHELCAYSANETAKEKIKPKAHDPLVILARPQRKHVEIDYEHSNDPLSIRDSHAKISRLVIPENQDSNIPDIASPPSKSSKFDPLKIDKNLAAPSTNINRTSHATLSTRLNHSIIHDPFAILKSRPCNDNNLDLNLKKRPLELSTQECTKSMRLDPVEYLKRVKNLLSKSNYKLFQSLLRKYKANEVDVGSLLESMIGIMIPGDAAKATEDSNSKKMLFQDFRCFIGSKNYRLFDEFFAARNF